MKAILSIAVILLVGTQAGAGVGSRDELGRTAATRSCRVTLPGGTYGNSSLTTGLWPHNVVIGDSRFIQPDGSVKMKFPWWRGTAGELKISGRRLDARARPLGVEITPGYGLTGLQPTYLIFPTGGCWRISARVGTGQTLTFVTMVVKAPYLTGR